jgi:hypothetical protein
MRKGLTWPPSACDVRIRYDQTIGDLKAAVAETMGVPVAQQQLFWHKQELTAAYDDKTLLDMSMHTGFALKGYDLVSGSNDCIGMHVAVCADAAALLQVGVRTHSRVYGTSKVQMHCHSLHVAAFSPAAARLVQSLGSNRCRTALNCQPH